MGLMRETKRLYVRFASPTPHTGAYSQITHVNPVSIFSHFAKPIIHRSKGRRQDKS